ncbi:MFS transporter [soil metagenome]
MATGFLRPYLDLLTVRGGWRFSLAAWFGRIIRSTAGIGAILLVAARSDNYALAGAVSGSVVLGSAIAGPVWSRAADSRGQTRVLPFAIASSALAAAALVVAVELGGPEWTWFGAALLVGATSIDAGSLARARWIHLLPSAERRHTALALESVGDEFTFVIGPPVVTLLAGLVSPVFGFAVGVGLSLLGLAALVVQRSTAPKPEPVAVGGGRWLPAGVIGLLPGYAGVGLVFGSVDLTAVGVARETGTPAVAGLLLAVFAVGSVSSGFVFGSVSAGWRPLWRLGAASLAFAAVAPLFLVVHEVPVLALVSLAAGIVTTPVLISGASLIESVVARSVITTAMAWPTVALSLGVTVGATLAGAAIDERGSWAGLIVPALAGLLVGASGLANAVIRSRLRSADHLRDGPR